MTLIAENLKAIKAKIAKCGNTGVIAVSKNHGAEAVLEAIKADQLLFGENRVQEAYSKFPDIKKQFPAVRLHLIGPLQTNKVKDALALFDVIQTLDREKLAREFAKHNAKQEMFIQVNIGREEQKAGIAPEEAEGFYKLCTQELGLNVVGLMCIPPADLDPVAFFNALKEIRDRLDKNLKLSMGMSGDYEIAAQMGASYVRIGTAIFGSRNY